MSAISIVGFIFLHQHTFHPVQEDKKWESVRPPTILNRRTRRKLYNFLPLLLFNCQTCKMRCSILLFRICDMESISLEMDTFQRLSCFLFSLLFESLSRWSRDACSLQPFWICILFFISRCSLMRDWISVYSDEQYKLIYCGRGGEFFFSCSPFVCLHFYFFYKKTDKTIRYRFGRCVGAWNQYKWRTRS